MYNVGEDRGASDYLLTGGKFIENMGVDRKGQEIKLEKQLGLLEELEC